MFQLIVAVISIALVAALAIASIFYGGDAFTKSSEKAIVTTLINQGQQIAGAAALYKTDNGVDPVSIADLELSADGVEYLADVPSGARVTDGNGWEISGDVAQIAFSVANANEICLEVDRQGAGNCSADYAYFQFDL